jgi:Flp pilus assembly protein TadG
MTKNKKKLSEQRGAALVELAIVIIPLILILFGTVEFGLLLYNQQVITNASREGARAGIVSQNPRLSDAQIAAVVTTYCNGRLVTFGAANNPVTQVTPADRSGSIFGDDLTVAVTYTYDFLVLSNFGFGQRNMTATTVMKME